MENTDKYWRKSPTERGLEIFKNRDQGISFDKNEGWFMFLKNPKTGKKIRALVSPEMAKIIKLGLYAQIRKERIQPITKIGRLLKQLLFFKPEAGNKHFNKYNCHKTIASITTQPKFTDDVKNWNPEYISLISPKNQFKYFGNFQSLSKYAQQQMGNEHFGIGQIYDWIADAPMHSFLFSKDINNSDILCFEKVGAKNSYPFQITTLETIFKQYQIITLKFIHRLEKEMSLTDAQKTNLIKATHQYNFIPFSEFKKKVNDGFQWQINDYNDYSQRISSTIKFDSILKDD
jgi:hypothetical protein